MPSATDLPPTPDTWTDIKGSAPPASITPEHPVTGGHKCQKALLETTQNSGDAPRRDRTLITYREGA
jgi:hypothetical protein